MKPSQRPHEVRIIGGQWKRSKLTVPDKEGLRPTPDRVRETLFNWLGQELGGCRVLDAFAGTGALGFEAASRGATRVVCLEREPALVGLMREAKTRLQAVRVEVLQSDAMAWMARAMPSGFDLIFIDPPFDERLHARAIKLAVALLADDAWLYVEAREALPAPEGLIDHRHLRAGNVHAHLWRKGQGTAATLPADPPVPEETRRSIDDNDDDRED
jgi:16S rRNA (guanine966-N2)-methyltransferase